MAVLIVATKASAIGLTYSDADDDFFGGNPNISPLSAFELNGFIDPNDNLWQIREPAGYEGPDFQNIWEATGNSATGGEDVPEVTQTIRGLTPGESYNTYAVFWTNGESWVIQTGTTSGALTYYDAFGVKEGATASLYAGDAIWASPPVLPNDDDTNPFTEGDRTSHLAFAGTVTADGNGEAQVYIDDAPGGGTGSADRTWYDGVAYISAGLDLSATAVVDRDTGLLTLSNNTGGALAFTGVNITSASQALDASQWDSITDNYDEGGAADTDAWEVTAPLDDPLPAYTGSLAEIESVGGAGGAMIADGNSLLLGEVWRDTRFEDLQVQLTLASGSTLTVTPTYSGAAHLPGDFDNNGAVDISDYFTLRDNLLTDVSTLSQAEAYLLGDMDGDLAINHSDFVAFRDAFPGALAQALAAVPEPSSSLLLLAGAVFASLRRGRRYLEQGDCERTDTTTDSHLRTSQPTMTSLSICRVALAIALALTLLTTPARAADVSLTGIDGFGTSSFGTAGLWANGAAPSAGNDYFIETGTRLRTPADSASYTFGGDSLTIRNTDPYPEGLMYKGTGAEGVITINNLILDGGLINHANGLGDVMQLDGSIHVASVSRLHAKQGNINILAPISGAGGLTILGTDDGADTANRIVTFSGANTYSGDIAVEAGGKLTVGATGSMAFDIGASGVSNVISGDGFAVFDGAFSFDTSGASSTLGDSWTVSTVANQTFGENFSVIGFNDLGDTWFDGTYTFDTTTGTLSVAPAPQRLKLKVFSNGQVQIVNDDVVDGVDFNYYEVRSFGGALDSTWGGIDGGAASGELSWETAGGSSATVIAETNLLGSEALSLTDSVAIGAAYTGGLEDLEFYYGLPGDGELVRGFVEYVTVDAIDGDFNNDGVVDAADYTVYRDNLNTNNSLPNDGGLGVPVTSAHHTLWANNYGATATGSSLGTAVPEPGAVGCVLLSILGATVAARRAS